MTKDNRRLSERFREWAKGSSFVAFSHVLSAGIRNIAEVAIAPLYKHFMLATKPLVDLQPQKPASQEPTSDEYPLWWKNNEMVNFVNNINLQGLIDALEGKPVIPLIEQKLTLLAAELSFEDFPLQKKLIQYGLHDNVLAHIYGGIRAEAAIRKSKGDTEDIPDEFIEGAVARGLREFGLYQKTDITVKQALTEWAKGDCLQSVREYVAQQDIPEQASGPNPIPASWME